MAACALLAASVAGPGRGASADDAAHEAAMEVARQAKVKELRKELRKWAGHPHEAAHKDELLASIAALKTIGGVGAARGVMDVFPSTDTDLRDKAFEVVELVHDKALLAPLAEHIEHKDFRRDFDLHKRIAHALAVIADPAAIEHLTTLVQSPDAYVVAAAADALAVFGEAKTDLKREAVQRMVDVYESTWNVMNSVRPEDRVAAKIAYEKWEIYSKPVRHALQTLTKQQITQSKDWRRWWNDHKKDDEWKAERAPAGPAR